MPVVAKPFINDAAKQERFEQFLHDKYQGGLRSTESGRASHMSEAARALERLDFEVAAEAIKKGKWSKEISTSLTGGMEFTSGGFVVWLCSYDFHILTMVMLILICFLNIKTAS